jgi:hypothetical protein
MHGPWSHNYCTYILHLKAHSSNPPVRSLYQFITVDWIHHYYSVVQIPWAQEFLSMAVVRRRAAPTNRDLRRAKDLDARWCALTHTCYEDSPDVKSKDTEISKETQSTERKTNAPWHRNPEHGSCAAEAASEGSACALGAQVHTCYEDSQALNPRTRNHKGDTKFTEKNQRPPCTAWQLCGRE